eukprot:CAMPEP_0204558322 /NCGR_PEP_ID=MMETSP0661-20131031/31015_1 /ASSEMBLY_ACC=CAM_ASM_000606 /TAXON_ID=109239 /ORGANISM="Alexandrium margalefi, Strain AMGDE01CS-322" /LENGTH=54 /DNA_ID=CAMNT_0051565497 /DNA_START=207 /DNA_END=368 /DNA_ORIENTATION=+
MPPSAAARRDVRDPEALAAPRAKAAESKPNVAPKASNDLAPGAGASPPAGGGRC